MLSKPEKLGKLSNCPKSGNPAKTSSKDEGWRSRTTGGSRPEYDVTVDWRVMLGEICYRPVVEELLPQWRVRRRC